MYILVWANESTFESHFFEKSPLRLMDIDNLGMVEAEILQAPETRLPIFYFLFFISPGW